jgi:phosphoribosylformylglycinamidine synthase I
MKYGVVVFPGSNCDADMMHVLGTVLGAEVVKLWHKDQDLSSFETTDCIILPGGFSYGDYLRCGAIARFSPIMTAVTDFAKRGGLVFGICNGFQILCEAGLLPGALLLNNHQQFSCKNVWLKTETSDSKITQNIPDGRILKIPIAHAEGRYYTDPAGLAALKQNNQILFTYCDADGAQHDASNPNGSLAHIAGICNETRNVFGMMPHPERASESVVGNTDGLAIFESLLSQVGTVA